MTKKVLISYNLFREGFEELGKKCELIFPETEEFERKELIEKIQDCDALLSMFSVNVNRELIDAGRKLKIISNYGVGYNNIDVLYASQKGIVIANTPDPVVEPTAELAFALMLAAARRIAECDRKLREKDAVKWGVLQNLGIGLYRKTLGIVGMGRIGQAVARRAIASGMTVCYYNRNKLDKKVEEAYKAAYLPLEKLMTTSDYISLNVPLTDETFHLINRDTLKLIKKSAILINTSRGPVIDETALIESLQSGHLGGAALDVFEKEPVISPPLLTMDNVVLSPHNGTATTDARIAMNRYAAENILRFFSGKEPLSKVN